MSGVKTGLHSSDVTLTSCVCSTSEPTALPPSHGRNRWDVQPARKAPCARFVPEFAQCRGSQFYENDAAVLRSPTRRQRDILKVDCDLRGNTDMRFRFIEDRRDDYSVRQILPQPSLPGRMQAGTTVPSKMASSSSLSSTRSYQTGASRDASSANNFRSILFVAASGSASMK